MQNNYSLQGIVNPQPQNIPDQLKSPEKLWALLELAEDSKGKLAKRPVSPLDLRGIGSSSQYFDHMCTFFKASEVQASASRPYCLAICLRHEQEIGAIDIDGCIESGQILPAVIDLIRRLGSYAERSPSGAGVRVFFLKPDGLKNKSYKRLAQELGVKELVVSAGGKFVSATGHRINDDQTALIRNDQFFAELAAKENDGHAVDTQLELITDTKTISSPTKITNLTSAVHFLSGYSCDRDMWTRMALALKREKPEEEMFRLFVDFSKYCPEKFSQEACRRMWDSIGSYDGKPLTAGSVFYEATRQGWTPPAQEDDHDKLLPDGRLATNVAHAKRVVERYGDLFGYYHPDDSWHVYDFAGRWARGPKRGFAFAKRNFALLGRVAGRVPLYSPHKKFQRSPESRGTENNQRSAK